MSKRQRPFIDQVRHAARESGMTQKALAETAGLDLAAVNRFVRGERGLSVASMNALAKTLKLRVVAEERHAPSRRKDRP